MRIALIVVPLVLIAAIAAFLAWKILGLKQRLVTELEVALHATAQIGSLNLDIGKGELNAANITLQNQRADAPWDNAAIDQAAIHFHFADIFASTLPVQVELTGWKASLHTTAQPYAPAPDAGTPVPAMPTSPAGPSWIRITAVTASQGEITLHTADNSVVLVHGVAFHSDSPSGNEWTTQLTVGSIAAGTFVTSTGSVELHSDETNVTFNNLIIHCGDGTVTGSGELGLQSPHTLKGNFTANAVPISMLVATRWQVKVSGLVSGTLAYQGDDSTATATGHVSVAGGKFNLFPWLGKVTLLVGLPDAGGVELDKAESDFTWKNHVLSFTNIDLRKEGVFRIAGQDDILADGSMDGHLKLGLPTVAVSKWPKLQTEIFTSPQDDYSYADVHVTGTPEAPQEDLSGRVLSVTAEQGVDLIKQGAQGATDLLNKFLK
jgi:hypothetical protein